MTPIWINRITNIIAILLVILGSAQTYLTTQPFNLAMFLVAIGGAITNFFIGKGSLNLEKRLKAKGMVL
jgi:hypothetical protein